MSMMRLSSPESSVLGKNMFIVIAENCIDRSCPQSASHGVAGDRLTYSSGRGAQNAHFSLTAMTKIAARRGAGLFAVVEADDHRRVGNGDGIATAFGRN